MNVFFFFIKKETLANSTVSEQSGYNHKAYSPDFKKGANNIFRSNYVAKGDP